VKNVQRADDDPTLFDVVYYGTHICVERTAAAGHLGSPAPDAHGLLQCKEAWAGAWRRGRLAAATEPQNLNDATTLFCPSSTSPVSLCLSPDIADEFLDVIFELLFVIIGSREKRAPIIM
jgi:hypothetical protein